MPTTSIGSITFYIAGDDLRRLHDLAQDVVARATGPWLPVTEVDRSKMAVRAQWPSRDDPEPHELRRLSDLLNACIEAGRQEGGLCATMEPLVVTIRCDDVSTAVMVAKIADSLGGHLSPEGSPSETDGTLLVTLVWSDDGRLVPQETLLAVAEFLRQCGA